MTADTHTHTTTLWLLNTAACRSQHYQ